MNYRGRIVISVVVALVFCLTPVSQAAHFVFQKLGNIRSGPGTKYRVVGQLSKETIAEIPATFHDYDAKWIPIDAKTEYDQKSKAEKVVYTRWVHSSLGVVIPGDLNEVDKYFAIKESGWQKDMQDLVLAGKVVRGMNTHMVFYAWGRPDEVKETTGADGSEEQWVYKRSGSETRHLFFKDGVLTDMK